MLLSMAKKLLILGVLISILVALYVPIFFTKKDAVKKDVPERSLITIAPTPISTSTPTKALPIPKIESKAKFVTLPRLSILPENQECISKAKRSAFEPRPENYTANQTVVSQGPYIEDVFKPERITGNFTGVAFVA